MNVKKYIRGFWKGSKETKINLWSLVAIFCIAIALGIIFLVTSLSGVGFLAFLFAIFGVMYSQTLSIKNLEMEIEEEKTESKNEKIKKENPSGQSKKEQESIKENYLNAYTKKELERLFSKYKVKKQSRSVLIDYSKEYKIKQCPAFIWKDKVYFHLLLLEKEPRKISIELKKIQGITYEKCIVTQSSSEYTNVKESPIIQYVFKEYLPRYYTSTSQNRPAVMKNLYLVRDIRFTNTSARNLFDILKVKFQLEHQKLQYEKYGAYFNEAYKLNVLWRDEVYTIEEYREKIKTILKDLAHNEINFSAFQEIITNLVQYRLITQEYAEFFEEYRVSLEERKKERDKNGKR